MITAKNLKKAGFVRNPSSDLLPGKVEAWDMDIRGNINIEVILNPDRGTSVWLNHNDDNVRLNLTSVTDLLTLAKLLK